MVSSRLYYLSGSRPTQRKSKEKRKGKSRRKQIGQRNRLSSVSCFSPLSRYASHYHDNLYNCIINMKLCKIVGGGNLHFTGRNTICFTDRYLSFDVQVYFWKFIFGLQSSENFLFILSINFFKNSVKKVG